jgi:hypothetical protein
VVVSSARLRLRKFDNDRPLETYGATSDKSAGA